MYKLSNQNEKKYTEVKYTNGSSLVFRLNWLNEFCQQSLSANDFFIAGIVLLSALNVDKIFFYIIHLLKVDVYLARNSDLLLFFESFLFVNFFFLRDVVVVFQRNISGNAENFGGKFVYAVIASVLFSPLIRPFIALIWTSSNCMQNYCWTVPYASLLIPESVSTICSVS